MLSDLGIPEQHAPLRTVTIYTMNSYPWMMIMLSTDTRERDIPPTHLPRDTEAADFNQVNDESWNTGLLRQCGEEHVRDEGRLVLVKGLRHDTREAEDRNSILVRHHQGVLGVHFAQCVSPTCNIDVRVQASRCIERGWFLPSYYGVAPGRRSWVYDERPTHSKWMSEYIPPSMTLS